MSGGIASAKIFLSMIFLTSIYRTTVFSLPLFFNFIVRVYATMLGARTFHKNPYSV